MWRETVVVVRLRAARTTVSAVYVSVCGEVVVLVVIVVGGMVEVVVLR